MTWCDDKAQALANSFEDKRRQQIHEGRVRTDLDHDLSSCWCCCWDCVGDDDES